jgi:hypothetical protein
MDEPILDWLHLPPGVEEIDLWAPLHDARVERIDSDRLARTARLVVDVEHLRERLGGGPDLRFVLELDAVKSVRASVYAMWPGPPPRLAPGTPRDLERATIEEYQAKWREESIAWEALERALDGAHWLWIYEASAAIGPDAGALRLLASMRPDDRLYVIAMRGARLTASRSDGEPLGLEGFRALGEAYWDDRERRSR